MHASRGFILLIYVLYIIKKIENLMKIKINKDQFFLIIKRELSVEKYYLFAQPIHT